MISSGGSQGDGSLRQAQGRLTADQELRLRGLEFNLFGLCDATRGVQDFERYEVALGVVVEDHAGLILVTFGDGALFQDEGEYV